jgi:hypothetical protein
LLSNIRTNLFAQDLNRFRLRQGEGAEMSKSTKSSLCLLLVMLLVLGIQAWG